MIIILRIIFMVGRGDKQRVEIDHFDSEILQIIQLLSYALQIAAVEIADIHRGRPLIPVLYVMHMAPDVGVFIVEYIILLIAPAETVRIDLIHDRALCPVGCGESRTDPEP